MSILIISQVMDPKILYQQYSYHQNEKNPNCELHVHFFHPQLTHKIELHEKYSSHLQQNIFIYLTYPLPHLNEEVCWKLWNGNNENNQKISPGTHSFQLFFYIIFPHIYSLCRHRSNNIESGKKFFYRTSFFICAVFAKITVTREGRTRGMKNRFTLNSSKVFFLFQFYMK